MKSLAENYLTTLQEHKDLIESKAKKGKFSVTIEYKESNEEIYEDLKNEYFDVSMCDDEITIDWS